MQYCVIVVARPKEMIQPLAMGCELSMEEEFLRHDGWHFVGGGSDCYGTRAEHCL